MRFRSRYRKFRASLSSRHSSGRRFIMRCTHAVLRRLGDYLIFVSRQDFAYDRVCHRLAVCKCQSIWEARDSIRRPYAAPRRGDIRGITDPRRVNLQGFRPPLNRRSCSLCRATIELPITRRRRTVTLNTGATYNKVKGTRLLSVTLLTRINRYRLERARSTNSRDFFQPPLHT